jgi:branched-chain amino acid transport system permease protein
MTFGPAELTCQLLVGISRSMILFIVCAGLSFVLGVLRIPNIAHGTLYMIGAFATFSITAMFAGSAGFWIALILAPLLVAVVSLVAERALFCHLYQREHLMLLLFTFAISLILGDLVKIVWGAEYKSVSAPALLKGSISLLGASFPRYNLFLILVGPLCDLALYE